MEANLDVAFLPATLKPDALVDRAVVVVDVLRATTSIISALNSGADHIVPSPSIERARELHEEIGGNSVMGGERGGKKVDGFQCGNSPPEYSADAIKGKILILATTNGTVAMEQCRDAKAVLIGAFVNIGAVAERLRSEPNATILCSGTDRHITSEDVLFAGALAERMLADNPTLGLHDGAQIALHHWQMIKQKIAAEQSELADFMRIARGGRNLVRIGHDNDIVFASQQDTIPIVPELDLDSWTIR